MPTKPIPEGYHTATPYLIVKNGKKAIEFYKKAFNAKELSRFEDPATGTLGHAEIKVGDSIIMLADETADQAWRSPEAFGGTPVSLMLYVDDVDKVFPRAITAGARETKPLTDQFYGDRSGTLTDPFGHVWTVATHKEDLTPEEMNRRFREATQHA
ncbi:MAG TPA: VOC family protein [Gemmatimonadales bacterium]|jgi:PhnB protein